ncbi:MAG: hypothetical protein M3Y27_11880 [Acidobacteriota bacterium]|nr:hypothetical protein [Acidobacteriota bacterium]
MTHEQTKAMWLARWQGLRSSGLTMTEYARRGGFNAHSAYRWLRRSRLSGQWSDSAVQPELAIAVAKPPVRFARVAVSDAPRPGSPIVLRVMLTNGRGAELEIGGIAQLGEVLGALQRRA